MRRHRLLASAIAVAIAMVLLWLVLALLRPLPPHTVVMATGPAGGAYAAVGVRYRDILAHEGIDLRLLPTAGALENLAKLQDPRSRVSVGFLQAGTTSAEASPDLVSLGTISYEALWFFCRKILQNQGLEGLRGRRLSIGPEGSGTRALALKLLALNGINEHAAELLPFMPEEAGKRLVRGEIDGAMMVTAWDSSVVRELFSSEGIRLVSFPRADAYVALNPFLNKVVVPTGAIDLTKDLPPADVVLLAAKASLVVRNDVHTALQYMLLAAASQIHGHPGIFQKAGEFPAPEMIDLPLSRDANRFYRSGLPFFQRYLPFWLAVLVERLLVLVIPIVGVGYPLVRILPSIYDLGMRRRIYSLYGELKFLEVELEKRDGEQGADDLLARLQQLESRANHLRVPTFFADRLYTLRMHLKLAREEMEKRRRADDAI